MNATKFFACMAFVLPAYNAYTQLAATATVETAAPAVEAPAVETNKFNYDLSGYVDMYYRYAGNKLGSVTSFTEAHDAFALGMANVVLSGSKGKFGFFADLGFGPRAIAANYTDQGINSAVKQLFLTYSPTSKIKLTAGNFATFVGYESIDPTANAQYSTSYMFSKGPFFHTGLKADFTLSSKLSAMIGLFNDTDSKFDVVGKKHFGAQLTYAQGPFKAVLNYLAGREAEDPARATGHQVDLVSTLQVAGKTSLGLNLTQKMVALRESDETSKWAGGALYVNQGLTDAFSLALRGEVFSDPDGLIFAVPENTVYEFTLAGAWKVEGFTLIPEIRFDSAKEAVFTNNKEEAIKSYPSFLIAAVYKF